MPSKKLTLYILALTAYRIGVRAIWPFPEQISQTEGLVDAGGLGLDISGRVVAVGDWNGDQHADLFSLTEDGKGIQIHLWHKDRFNHIPSHSRTTSNTISNVIPGDYDQDGRLDLLVMSDVKGGGWWSGDKDHTAMEIWFGGTDGGFRDEIWSLPQATGQGVILDSDGSLRPSLLAYESAENSEEGRMRLWYNNGTGISLLDPPLNGAPEACILATPHSSAFVDIDGDCLPDLVLHCTRPRSSQHFIQIYINRGPQGFAFSRSHDLPKGAGPLSFADFNRDGTIDIIFPVCARHTTSSGIGHDCSISIAYNKQIPTCSSEASQLDAQQEMRCRGYGDMCTADANYSFDFEDLTSIPLSAVLPADGEPQLLLHPPNQPLIPLPLRTGDYNVDGFPDLLMTIYNATAAPSSGSVFSGSRRPGHQVRVLENVPCGKNIPGCETDPRGRGLRVGSGLGWEALHGIWDASGASWLDVNDDGSLDMMIQRTGEQSKGLVTFIKNNFYHDAFFLKAQLLNGACDGLCQPTTGGKKYSALGASYPGATYKFTVLDTLGRRVAQQVAQLPQSAHHALGTPYAYIGLGRTNNYVERLFVGSSSSSSSSSSGARDHFTTLESLIPNSQLIINPPFPVPAGNSTRPDTDGDASTQPVTKRSTEWRSQLYLHPGDWIPWVGAAVVGTVLALGGVVIALNKQEKREDEKERRRALHAINFQAL